MNDPAIISGSLVDVRNVGVHKAVRLTIHVPAEYAMKVFEAFGWPTSVDPVSVAIARLHSLPQRPPAVEATPQPAPIGQAAPAGTAPRVRSPAQIAGYICTLPSFHKFLQEKFPVQFNEALEFLGPYTTFEKAAAECVRDICTVDSRADITKDNAEWSALLLAYRLWEKEAEILEA